MKIIKLSFLVRLFLFSIIIHNIILLKTGNLNKKRIRKNTPQNLYPKFLQISASNPDQAAGGAGGGDSGEFLRRNQPQEHIIIPLINSLEAEYNPLFSDIRKYRRKVNKIDKGIEYKKKLNFLLNSQLLSLLK
jgi:hypothetical protein